MLPISKKKVKKKSEQFFLKSSESGTARVKRTTSNMKLQHEMIVV